MRSVTNTVADSVEDVGFPMHSTYEDYSVLVYDAVYFDGLLRTFLQKFLLFPS